MGYLISVIALLGLSNVAKWLRGLILLLYLQQVIKVATVVHSVLVKSPLTQVFSGLNLGVSF